MFLGQGMDSSMSPQAIMMNQPVPKMPQQQPMKQGPRNYKALEKMSSQYMTPDQHRSSKRSGGV